MQLKIQKKTNKKRGKLEFNFPLFIFEKHFLKYY